MIITKEADKKDMKKKYIKHLKKRIALYEYDLLQSFISCKTEKEYKRNIIQILENIHFLKEKIKMIEGNK